MTSALSVPSSQLSQPAGVSWPEVPPGAEPLPGQLDHWLAAQGAELIAVRRHLHSHPELSHQEFQTAELVARELTAAGLAPRMLPAGNGVICDVGQGAKAIALRADLDALPLQDIKEVDYRSTVSGVTHACGHDVHTTILLGAAKALARLQAAGQLPGRVRLIFQPAEESYPFGAPQVISAGGLKDVAAIFALHCAPRFAAGEVGVRSGPMTAAADWVVANLVGPGGHTARPHTTVDLVHSLSRVVVDVPAIMDRRVDPRARLSLVFGSVHAGAAPNTIPSSGSVQGTVRVLDHEAWQVAPELIPRLIREVAAVTGAEAEVCYTRGVPSVINSPAAADVVTAAAQAAVGPEGVKAAEVSMGSEDFAFYLEHVPGAMVRLGTGAIGAQPMDIHQASFDVDESAIGYGVRLMTHTALRALTAEGLA